MANNSRIVEGYGYFYSNYDSTNPDLPDFIENSELGKNYGLVIGPQQVDQFGNKHANIVGLYIKDYERYVDDLAAAAAGLVKDPIITEQGMFYKNMEVMFCISLVCGFSDISRWCYCPGFSDMREIKSKYGLRCGPAIDSDPNCEYAEWGLYIVNYEQYLKDRQTKCASIRKKLLDEGKNSYETNGIVKRKFIEKNNKTL